MSKLGDYVHLHFRTYRKYGVANETGGNVNVSPILYNYCDSKAFINERLNQVSEVSDEAIDILRARLKSNTQQELDKEEQKWRRDQQQQIDVIYELLFTQVNSIANKQGGGASQLYKTTSAETAWHYNKKEGKAKILSNTSQWASSYSYEQLKALRKKKQQQYARIKNLIKKINQNKQPQSDADLKKLTELYTEYTDIIPKQQFNTAAEIEKAIGDFRYSGTIQQVAGEFGEQLVAACDDAANTMGKREFINFLQEAIKGENISDISFDKSLISPENISFLRKKDKYDNEYYLGTTKDKTDVNIHINDEDLFVSVKDYAAEPGSFSNPSLQDVNLFQSLLFLNNYLDNFGNHWLNMHALHNGGGWAGEQEANEILSKEIAYEALTSGSPFKSATPANVFVYIDRAKGYVFVEKTSDLLLNHFDKFTMRKVEDIVLNNRRVSIEDGGILARIESLLNQVHNINISVGLNIRPR